MTTDIPEGPQGGQPLALGSTEGLGPLLEGETDPARLWAEIRRLEAKAVDDAAEKALWIRRADKTWHEKLFLDRISKLEALLARYRDETPIGHQPHMIAHQADEALGRA
jgi:hypothetical protein